MTELMTERDEKVRKSLPVLPTSSKLEQWRRENDPQRESPSEDVPMQSHVNRLEAEEREAEGLERKIVDVLRDIFDPEIPINIYDMGLIYDINITPENTVDVKMTLTAPGCPVAGTLPPMVGRRIEAIPEVKSAKVELVWEPAWTREMMSEVARLELGL